MKLPKDITRIVRYLIWNSRQRRCNHKYRDEFKMKDEKLIYRSGWPMTNRSWNNISELKYDFVYNIKLSKNEAPLPENY